MKTTKRGRKMTGMPGQYPGAGTEKTHAAAKAKHPKGKHVSVQSKGGNIPIKDKPQPHVMSMMGKHPFEMKAKKPEPDDRPRPARPPSQNKNMKNSKSARTKRLTGMML